MSRAEAQRRNTAGLGQHPAPAGTPAYGSCPGCEATLIQVNGEPGICDSCRVNPGMLARIAEVKAQYAQNPPRRRKPEPKAKKAKKAK